MCLKAVFVWHTVLSNGNSEFYIYDIYPYLNRTVCPLMGSPTWLDEGLVQAGVLSCSDDVTHRSYANFKCEVADVNNGFPIDFRAIQCVSMESGQPCRDTISWHIFKSTDLYNSFFTGLHLHAVYSTWLTPVTACGSQSTACGIEMRRESLGLVSTVCFRKKIWSENWYFFFMKKIFIPKKIKWNNIKIQNHAYFID